MFTHVLPRLPWNSNEINNEINKVKKKKKCIPRDMGEERVTSQ